MAGNMIGASYRDYTVHRISRQIEATETMDQLRGVWEANQVVMSGLSDEDREKLIFLKDERKKLLTGR